MIEKPPELPKLNFLIGSIEDACGLNDCPTFWHEIAEARKGVPPRMRVKMPILESEECQTALETHINSINPYLWGATDENRQFNFVETDPPLTFERIFADPLGDLARVQDALSRPECLLTGDQTNWELKETCHADAFLNFALFNRFCFNGGIGQRRTAIYRESDNPTLEQDRWI